MLFKYKIIDYRFCKPPSPHTVKYSLKRNDTVRSVGTSLIRTSEALE
jgi:hypothetical protein